MPVVAYNSVVKASGTVVPVVNEACSLVSGSNPNELYRVTNAARRIWDPTAAIVVKDGGVTVAAGLYTFDFLAGTIQFVGYTQTGAITVDGSYIPTVAIAEIRKYDFKLNAALPDVTTFDSVGWRQFIQSLKTLELHLEILSSPLTALDGAGETLFAWLTSDRPKVIEINRGGQFIRAWYKYENITDSAPAVDGVLTLSVQHRGSARGAGAAFSIS